MQETIEDLKKLNLNEVIILIEKINSLFPNSIPPPDIDERNDIISSFDNGNKDLEELLEQIDNEFYVLEEEIEVKLEPIVRRII